MYITPCIHGGWRDRQMDSLTDSQALRLTDHMTLRSIQSFCRRPQKKKKKNPVSFLVSATNVSRWLMYFNWSRSDFFPSLILLHGLIYFNKCKLIIRHFPNKDGRPLTHLASLQTQQMFIEIWQEKYLFLNCLIYYEFLANFHVSGWDRDKSAVRILR